MQELPLDEKNWVSVQEAVAQSLYSERHIRLLAKTKKVLARRVGKRMWLIYLPGLERYAPARVGWPAGKKRGETDES